MKFYQEYPLILTRWGLLLFLLFGYSTLNRGFAYIGMYPIFIGELAIVFYLLTTNHALALSRFASTSMGFLWLLLFLYNIVIFIPAGFSDVGEAIRNSVYWVYTIFFYFGFMFASHIIKSKRIEQFERYIFYISVASVAYYLLFPIRFRLREMTDFLNGGSVSLVGYYSSLHALTIGFIFYALYYRSKFSTIIFVVGIPSVILISQARASLVSVVIVIVFFYIFERGFIRHRRFIWGAAFVIISIPILLAFNFSIEGQRGSLNFDFFSSFIGSIFANSGFESFDGTRSDRLLWWSDVVRKTLESNLSLIFGMGVDEVLVDRSTGVDTIIRYPHNSFVSIFGFSGVIGFMLYSSLLVGVFFRCIRCRSKRYKSIIVSWYPLFSLGYCTSAFFSTVFEAPFHSAVFWTITGVAYALTRRAGPAITSNTLELRV